MSQSLNDTEEQYQELLRKVDSLGGESGSLDSISQKVRMMKSDAEDLFNKAKDGIKELEGEYRKLI